MNKKQIFVRTALAIAVAGSTTSAFAAGFQLNGHSATGLGRAFAGDAVIADNASVISRNPAAMSLFDAPAITMGLVAIDTDVKVKDAEYKKTLNTQIGAIPMGTEKLSDEQIGGTSLVPNIYYVHPISSKWAVGAGLYSNFGTKTEFSSDYEANLFGGLTDVKSVNLGLATSYRINEIWSVGAGLDIIQGSGNLQRQIGTQKAVDIDADGIAFGWIAGATFEINKDNRLGFSYRKSPELKADGKIEKAGIQQSGDLLMPLPDLAEISGYHKLTNKFALSYSVQWIEWEEFKVLETEGASEPLNTYEWKNAWHFSVGGTYFLNEDWTLRAGYMYDMSAQDEITSISVPDSDRQWFSAGFTYHMSKHSDIDFGFTYLMGEDVNVNENKLVPLDATKSLLNEVTATTRANAWLYGIQYSYKF
ncbi:outer membrane protein transport protein [Parasalinivibrio latis]|uniref:porin n=1 Tax=Parasalinivibrio latis TaxID=2952610 RepID=UPI0030DE0817